MVFPGSLRASGLGRDALGVAIAGLGTCALTGYTWWSARGGVPTPDVSAAVLIAIGATAGLISGRFRAAPASWAAAVIGSMLAYSATVTIDPGLPAPNSGFSGNELLNAAFLLPFIAGGHLLGAWARIAQWRGAFGAAVAGLATCALCLYSFSSAPHGVPSPGASPAIGMWMAIGIWIAIGATAGLASGRFRDAPCLVGSCRDRLHGGLRSPLRYRVGRLGPGRTSLVWPSHPIALHHRWPLARRMGLGRDPHAAKGRGPRLRD